MDFVISIPKIDSKDTIYKVVDRLTKERHYIATTKGLDAKGLVELFLYYI